MVRLILMGLLPFLSVACRSASPPAPEQIYAVSPYTLCRDLQMARDFANCRVRMVFNAGDYVVAADCLQMPSSIPNAPPIMVLRPAADQLLPIAGQTVTVVGRCGQPIHDGVWRTRRVDFWLTVSECTFTVLVAKPRP